MVEARRGEPFHPEGFTDAQERLADLLFDTKTRAKVRRRIELPDGSFDFQEVVRDTAPIDFAQEGEFALKLHEKAPEAPLSPIYINLRNLPEDVLGKVGKAIVNVPNLRVPDWFTGIPQAGVALAKAFCQSRGMPYIDILEKEEREGNRRIIPRGDEMGEGRVLIIDDVVTKADTKLEAIKAVESLGFDEVDIVVLVDCEQGGKEQLEKAGYRLSSVFTMSKMLDYYLRVGKIDQTTYQNTIQGLRAQNDYIKTAS